MQHMIVYAGFCFLCHTLISSCLHVFLTTWVMLMICIVDIGDDDAAADDDGAPCHRPCSLAYTISTSTSTTGKLL